MEFKTINGHVLCEAVVPKKTECERLGVYAEYENFPQYRVLDCEKDFFAQPGDIVICCSNGTEFKHDGRKFYLFSENNVAGKVQTDRIQSYENA